jgi:hypothetical protein
MKRVILKKRKDKCEWYDFYAEIDDEGSLIFVESTYYRAMPEFEDEGREYNYYFTVSTAGRAVLLVALLDEESERAAIDDDKTLLTLVKEVAGKNRWTGKEDLQRWLKANAIPHQVSTYHAL